MEPGISILNVHEGDTKITFDPANPAECERAAGMVTDLLKRGYVLSIRVTDEHGKHGYTRATGFDPNTCEYLVDELPGEPAQAASKKRGRKKRLPAARVPVVAIARTARGCSPAWP